MGRIKRKALFINLLFLGVFLYFFVQTAAYPVCLFLDSFSWDDFVLELAIAGPASKIIGNCFPYYRPVVWGVWKSLFQEVELSWSDHQQLSATFGQSHFGRGHRN
jgi:hypothetical protein